MYYIFIYKDRRGFQRPDVCARTSKVICSTRGEFSEIIRIQVGGYTLLLSWPKTRYILHDDTYTQLIRRWVQRYLLKKIGESCLSGQNGKERPLYAAKSPQRKRLLPSIGERDNCSVYAISVILHCSRSLKLKCGRPYNTLQHNNISGEKVLSQIFTPSPLFEWRQHKSILPRLSFSNFITGSKYSVRTKTVSMKYSMSAIVYTVYTARVTIIILLHKLLITHGGGV